jgi:antitoxin CcdA
VRLTLKYIEKHALQLTAEEWATLAKLLVETLSDPAAAEAWKERNREALEAYNDHIERHGVFSEGLRSF